MPNTIGKFESIAYKSGKSEEELAFAQLIDAALDNGIISCEEESGGIFEFVFRDSPSRRYRVYFDRPKGDTGGAEQIIRASEFITAVLDRINNSYNCFFAPATNTRPSDAAVKARLFPGRDDVKVSYLRSVEGEYGSSSRIYELEFSILVAIGDRYERLSDHLVAHKNGTDEYGNPKVEYIYQEAPQHEVAKQGFKPDPSEMRDSRIEAEKIVNVVNKVKEKMAVLAAFRDSADSRLHRFMESLPDSAKGKVGEINLELCSVFVGAVAVTTYYYKIIEGSLEYELAIVWNKAGNEFNKRTKLYVSTDEKGCFAGLTYEQEKKKPDGTVELRSELDAEDKIVLANAFDPKVGLESRVTLLLPEWHKAGDVYKGIANCATSVDGFSGRLLSEFGYLSAHKDEKFLADSTEVLDGKTYLKADIDLCPYTEARLWRGVLTAEKVEFVGKNGKLTSGYIDGSVTSVKANRRVCRFCQKVFFADPDRYSKYTASHRLLDGESYCEGCKAKGGNLTVGGKRYMLYENVRHSRSEEAPNGKLMVVMTNSGSPAKASVGGVGNMFTCSNCKENIYYSGADALAPCGVCGEPLCVRCSSSRSGRERVANVNLNLCASCPKPIRDTDGIYKTTPLGGANSGKRLIRARVSGSKQQVLVLDGEKVSDNLYNCLICGDLVHKDSAKTESCAVCGRLVCPLCRLELASKGKAFAGTKMFFRSDLHNALVCAECNSDIDGKYRPELDKTREKIAECKAVAGAVAQSNAEIERDIVIEIKSNPHNEYFAHIPLINRLKLVSACKKKQFNKFTVRVSEIARISDRSYCARVDIYVNGTNYRFLNLSGKITLEEVR